MEQRDRPFLRTRPRGRDTRGEVGVAATADRDEDAAHATGRALHDGDVAWRRAQGRLDRRAEEVPTRTAPREHEQVRPLAPEELDDCVPSLPADGYARLRLRRIADDEIELAPALPRVGLGRRERLLLRHFDRA